jgi:hypothetical protein
MRQFTALGNHGLLLDSQLTPPQVKFPDPPLELC